MERDLSPAELDELLGVYALDAVDPDERAAIDAWLARSPNARREADELREAATMLLQGGDEPPADLWARIAARLGDGTAGDVPPLRWVVVDSGVRRGARRQPEAAGVGRARPPWLVAAAAAVAVTVAVAVGAVVGHRVSEQGERIDRLAAEMRDDAMLRAALAAAVGPGARSAGMRVAGGRVVARVITTVDGRGYFVAERLPALPAGRTYQLWALMGEEPDAPMVSVGVLGRAPTVVAFTADPQVAGFAVTEEAAPGVTVTDRRMLLEGWLA